MKKHLLILILLWVGATNIFAQTDHESDWVPTIFIDLSVDPKSEFECDDIEGGSGFNVLTQRGVFEVGGGLDYILFNGIAICTSVKYHHNGLAGAALKFGGGLKLLLSDENYSHLSLELGYKKALGKSFFDDGGQLRVGYYVSVAKIKYLQLIAGLFYSYDDYNLIGEKTFYDGGNKCEYMKFNSLGLSVGIAF